MEPMGKARARVTTVGGFARAYTPSKTKKWEAAFAAHYAALSKRKPLDVPCSVVINARFSLPKSYHKKRSKVSASPHVSKPDLDNIVKIALDALNGVAWTDDKLIVEVAADKWTLAQGEEGYVDVTVEPLDYEMAFAEIPR